MGTGRKKIPMKLIENINRRRVTFTKRRNGLFKKAEALSKLTGCRVAVLTFSSSRRPFLFGDIELLEAAAGSVFGSSNLELVVRKDSIFKESVGVGVDCGDKDLLPVDVNGAIRSVSVNQESGGDYDHDDGNGVKMGSCSSSATLGQCYFNDFCAANYTNFWYMDEEMMQIATSAAGGKEGVSYYENLAGDEGMHLGNADNKDSCFAEDELAGLIGNGTDDKDLCFNEDELAELMRGYKDSVAVDENVSCSHMMKGSLQVVPCNPFEHSCHGDTSTSAPMATSTIDLKESDELPGLCDVEGEEDDLYQLFLMKERLEALKKSVQDQLKDGQDA